MATKTKGGKMKYTALTDESKKAILEQTIAQVENEHYSNTLALKRAQASGEQAMIEHFETLVDNLEKQHKALTED